MTNQNGSRHFSVIASCTLVLIVLADCGNKEKIGRREGNIRSIHVDIKAASNIKLSEIYDSVDIIKLQTDTSAAIGEITGLKFCRNHLYFIAREEVIIFDKNGNFVYKITHSGNGAGEYEVVSDIFVEPDTGHTLVYDSKGEKIIRYDPEGNYLEEWMVHLDGYSFTKLNEDIYPIYIGAGSSYNEQSNFKLNYFSKGAKEISRRFIEIPENEEEFLHFGDLINFSLYNDTTSFLYTSNDTVYSLSEEGIDPRIYIDFGKNKMPASFLQAKYLDVRDFVGACEDTDFVYQIVGFFETDHMLAFACRHKSDFLHIYYSKSTKKVLVGSGIENDFLFPGIRTTTSPHNLPKVTDGTNLYTIVDAYTFIENVDSLRASLSPNQWKNYQRDHPKVADIYRMAKIEDNPVIIIGKPRI